MRAIARQVEGDCLPRDSEGSVLIPPAQIFLTAGQEYRVYGVSLVKRLNFHVMDDLSRSHWYPAALFDVTDTTIPEGWICNTFHCNGSLALVVGPEFVAKSVESYDSMVDNDINSSRLFMQHVDRMLEQEVAMLFKRTSDDLSADARDEVKELLRLEEKEYALEIICQELMNEGVLDLEECKTCIELGKSLKLDEAETIRWDFWKKLLNYRDRFPENGPT